MAINKIREMYLRRYGTVTMSFEQFKAYRQGELTLCEIQDLKKANKEINRLLGNPLVFKKATLIVALLLNLETKCYALNQEALDRFDKQMQSLNQVVDRVMQIVYVIQTVGFIICLILGLIEIIKAMINKSYSDIVGIGLKYLLGFSSLFIFPYLLKMIFEILGYNGGILW